MKLLLVRSVFTDIATLGDLYVNGKFFCCTLEDHDRDLVFNNDLSTLQARKVKGETCIPRGVYEVKITPSVRFKRLMPQIMNVPAFEGVRIHAGNTQEDTEGCPLLGMKRGYNFIEQSQMAFNEFFPILRSSLEHETCTIEILKLDLTQRKIV